MTAYVVFIRESPVHDPQEMQVYSTMPRAPGFTPNPLVVYGAQEPLEGAPWDGVAIVSFPSMEEARAWYNSPEYKAAAAHRMKAADYRTVIVEGFSP